MKLFTLILLIISTQACTTPQPNMGRERLKEWAKQEARDGVLQAGDIVILVELRTRTQIDRDKMVKELGVSWARKFETVTQYKQVTVKNKAA